MPRLFRKSQRYSISRVSWLAKIVLLDGTTIDINLQPDVTGASCMERVSQFMSITEIDFFGLQYDCKAGYKRWVDRDKSLRKQLEKHHISGAKNAELSFAVQFFVTNVTKLEFEITKYLYFLQLKHSVLEGEMRCNNEIACKLASYALQAEFGDYDEQQHTPSFLQEFVLFPPSIDPSPSDTLHERVLRLYQRYRGMSAAAAELMYIKLAQQLPEYGHEPLQQLESSGTRIWLGACFIGIFIKHSNGQPTVYFKWPEVQRMKVKDRHFGIETHQESIYFKMVDSSTAQYVLRMMVLQHMFFQTEYQGLGVRWSAVGSGKKKSASLHDISANAVHGSNKKKKNRSRSINLETASEIRASNFSRPLGRHQRDNLIDPISPVTSLSPRYDDATSLPERMDLGVAMTSPTETVGERSTYQTTAAWTNNTPERKKEKIKGLGRTGVIEKIPVQEDSIDIGHDLTHSSMEALDDTSREHSLEPFEDRTKLPNGNGIHHQYTSSDVSGGSQGSVDYYAQPRKHSFEGSRTPPTTKQYSIDDQWEKEATSGARDQRGQRLERILASNRVYSEFEEIPKVKLSAEIAGSSPNNVRKNRYREIVPYAENRVRLDPSRNIGQSDYINASYVNFNVGSQRYKYIVAQGPLEHTCGDFWQMIWEQETKIVLMLSNEVEDGKVKCHKYFPSDAESFIQFEQYRISLKFINKSPTTVSRGLNVKYIPTGEEREIMHMQYIEWPPHGIPEDIQCFVDYLKAVQSLRQKYDSNIPMVVHCSLGIGRSGVLVLADMLTITYNTGQAIDIPSSLQSLRHQRMHFVQTLGQYKFVYSILIQYIKNARLI